MTIRNGLYSITTKLLDGAHGGQTGVSVLRDGKMLGGGSVLYHFGSYQCSGGKWKGEVTSQEHTPTIDVRPFAGYVASMGFSGTYTDEGAEFEATALVGERSIRLKNSLSAADSGLRQGRSTQIAKMRIGESGS
jgi:hypothetical protein